MAECKKKDRLLEDLLRKIIIFVMVMAFIIPLISPQVFAASSVTISGGDQVKGGDTFTVTVTFGGGNVGRVDAQLIYDTDQLTYLSGGSSSGNTGYIQLKEAGTDGSIVFQIEFQAVSEGQATLDVTTNEMYDLDEMNIDTPSASKSINISGDAAQNELITETASPDQPVEADAEDPEGIDEEDMEERGVDEKPETPANLNLLFIAVAVVLVLLIVIISVFLMKKNRKASQHTAAKQTSKTGQDVTVDEAQAAPTHDRGREEEMDFSADKALERQEKQKIKKRASEETEVWGNWNMDDRDNPDDIEKW